MKLIIHIAVLLIISKFSYCQEKNSFFNLDTSKIGILNKFRGVDSVGLNNQDLILIDSLFFDCLTNHNKKLDSNNLLYLKPQIYFRQYLPFNAKGNRIVYINCFCVSTIHFPAWKKELVKVFDGGGCFFNLVINLTTKKYMDLRINGFP